MRAETTVKETPILMCGPMVVATLEGRKTKTRRIVKPQPPEGWSQLCCERYCPAIEDASGMMRDGKEIFGAYNEDWGVACPYGGPGDRLWVRETWQQIQEIGPREYRTVQKTEKLSWAYPIYAATYEGDEPPRWMPSIHMPRWASRITLEITDVRVERVQDITEADAIDEGAAAIENPDYDADDPADDEQYSHVAGFASLWDTINGDGSWKANPWIWAVSFRRMISQGVQS